MRILGDVHLIVVAEGDVADVADGAGVLRITPAVRRIQIGIPFPLWIVGEDVGAVASLDHHRIDPQRGGPVEHLFSAVQDREGVECVQCVCPVGRLSI